MSEATKLVKVARAMTDERPSWLPSAQWEESRRNGAVISNEEAEKIVAAIKAAPAVKIGGILADIRKLLGGLIP